MSFNLYLLSMYVFSILLFLGTPGPVTFLVINSSINGGFRAGFITIVGTNLASLVLILISFLVIQGLFAIDKQMLVWLTFFGGVYLFYFSISIIKENILINTKSTIKSKNYFKNGFIIGISNPKDILFFVAFFPIFFSVSNNSFISMSTLTFVWIILDYSILSLYSAFFSKIINIKIATIISKLSGFILFFLAIYMVYSTIIILSKT